MEIDPMIPVILSGGSGSRLWPLSRKLYPKQFLALTGELSLFQQTLQRLNFDGMQTPMVVCNLEHRFIVNEQLGKIGISIQSMLLEPFGRNTAPAVAMAALQLIAEGRDELMLILPADHVISDDLALRSGAGAHCRRGRRDGAVRHSRQQSGNRLRLYQGGPQRRWR
jgi:mannose-1-phosphate guanylyltransferase/mannose-6-phosphate isomerase